MPIFNKSGIISEKRVKFGKTIYPSNKDILMKPSLFILTILFCMTLQIQAQNSPEVISRLEIVDVKTGERTLVKEFDYLIEAPNWTPDGKYLIYNSQGLLYKIPVQGGNPELIPTGSAKKLNNDHVLSFDGTFFAISDQTKGQSQVFTVPFTGGEAKLITPKAPSYLHGISTDGKTLSYCADRNGNYDVYIIPTEGGEEIRLTDAEGLDDGPEYAPNGKHIWFCSVRSGNMQAWRMNLDGSDQKQMSIDDSNNWFPHVSPNGKLISFIAYNKDEVPPGSHPANKNVEIRLMSSKGGKSTTLVKLFGGQGTLNVNSWAPDSKKLAFVSYQLKK